MDSLSWVPIRRIFRTPQEDVSLDHVTPEGVVKSLTILSEFPFCSLFVFRAELKMWNCRFFRPKTCAFYLFSASIFVCKRSYSAACSMIGYWHVTVLSLSVCLSVTKGIVAKKRYILQQKCLTK